MIFTKIKDRLRLIFRTLLGNNSDYYDKPKTIKKDSLLFYKVCISLYIILLIFTSLTYQSVWRFYTTFALVLLSVIIIFWGKLLIKGLRKFEKIVFFFFVFLLSVYTFILVLGNLLAVAAF